MMLRGRWLRFYGTRSSTPKRVVYPSLEDTRNALRANGIDPDVIERAMMPKFLTEQQFIADQQSKRTRFPFPMSPPFLRCTADTAVCTVSYYCGTALNRRAVPVASRVPGRVSVLAFNRALSAFC
jgi:hypothetical protein